MGLLDKVKNFFYDEEDVEDEYEEETHKEVKKENKRKYDRNTCRYIKDIIKNSCFKRYHPLY